MEKIPTKIKRIVDQAGELDEQIKELERQKKALVEKLSDYEGYLEGKAYSVEISDYKRDVIVAEKVRALLTAKQYKSVTKSIPVTKYSFRPLEKEDE